MHPIFHFLYSVLYFDYKLFLNSWSLWLSIKGGFLLAICCIVLRYWSLDFILLVLSLHYFWDLNLIKFGFWVSVSFSSLKNFFITIYFFLLLTCDDVLILSYSNSKFWDNIFFDFFLFSNKHDIYLFYNWGNDIYLSPALGVYDDTLLNNRFFCENDFIVNWSFCLLGSLIGI